MKYLKFFLLYFWVTLLLFMFFGCKCKCHHKTTTEVQTSTTTARGDDDYERFLNGPSITGLPFIVEQAAGIWGPN